MSAEERNRDQRIVDAVLSEEGLAGDVALAAVLLDVRGLAQNVAPAMSAELLAALSAAQAVDAAAESHDAVVVSLDSRRGNKRRALIIGAAVIAAMGLGAGAAAASSEGFRQAAQQTFSGVVDVLNPGRVVPPAPQLPAPVETGGVDPSGQTPVPSSTGSPTAPELEEIPGIVSSPFPRNFVTPKVDQKQIFPERTTPERSSPAPSAVPGVPGELPTPVRSQVPGVKSLTGE
jgi:hypothetical protein